MCVCAQALGSDAAPQQVQDFSAGAAKCGREVRSALAAVLAAQGDNFTRWQATLEAATAALARAREAYATARIKSDQEFATLESADKQIQEAESQLHSGRQAASKLADEDASRGEYVEMLCLSHRSTLTCLRLYSKLASLLPPTQLDDIRQAVADASRLPLSAHVDVLRLRFNRLQKQLVSDTQV